MSNELVTHIALSDRVRVHVSFHPELAIPAELEAEVERLWEHAKSERELYNGSIFAFESYDNERIFGHFTEYRYFIATTESPELRDKLKIYPLGVSGATICNEHVLVGTRDLKLALYPGYLELVPSGSIEKRAYQHGEVDFFMQLMWELEEEAHLSEKNVQSMQPLGLFYSEDVGVYDLGLRITCNLKEYEMAEFESSMEYPLLRWMPIEEWEKEMKSPNAKIVPLSKAIWKAHCTVH